MYSNIRYKLDFAGATCPHPSPVAWSLLESARQPEHAKGISVPELHSRRSKARKPRTRPIGRCRVMRWRPPVPGRQASSPAAVLSCRLQKLRRSRARAGPSSNAKPCYRRLTANVLRWALPGGASESLGHIQEVTASEPVVLGVKGDLPQCAHLVAGSPAGHPRRLFVERVGNAHPRLEAVVELPGD